MFARTKTTPPAFARAQRGAVLMTALVLLTVMTIIGVSAMKFANLDARMAINASMQTRALRAAEGAVASAPSFVDDFSATISTTTAKTVAPTVGTQLTSKLTFTYRDETIAPVGGYSIGTMSFYYFDASAAGAVVAADAEVLARTVVQNGIRILGPASH